MSLAIYASLPERSRGRLHEESRPDFRNGFQRDRDRIIHSTSFRRLMHKTQVFVVHESDLYRTRLTHSIEVAQVARTLARRLNLNEDLAELVALSHDLGHPPFGHTGEDVLHEKMKNFGGFDHNAQAIRIVTTLENHYIGFSGLNLTWESLEGIAKHNGPVHGEVPWAMRDFCQNYDLELYQNASLEAQLAALSDDIAYNHHDLQDGLRAGLISDEQILEVPILARAFAIVDKEHQNITVHARRYAALSILFSWLVEDAYETTRQVLENIAPKSVADIRERPEQIARFSSVMLKEINILRGFLFKNVYRHQSVVEMRETATKMVSRTFDYLFENPETLPDEWAELSDPSNEVKKAQTICDYISGMTDRYLSSHWVFAHETTWGRDQ